jgi:hypothetical protein
LAGAKPVRLSARYFKHTFLFGGVALVTVATAHFSQAENTRGDWFTNLKATNSSQRSRCASEDALTLTKLGSGLLEVEGSNPCRASQVIEYNINGLLRSSTTDAFGNFRFLVTLKPENNQLGLVATNGSLIPLHNNFEEFATAQQMPVQNSPHSPNLVLQPASLILKDSNSTTKQLLGAAPLVFVETGGDQPFLLSATLSGKSKQKTANVKPIQVASNAFSVESSQTGLQPLPFADAPLSLSSLPEIKFEPITLEPEQTQLEPVNTGLNQESVLSSFEITKIEEPGDLPSLNIVAETVEPTASTHSVSDELPKLEPSTASFIASEVALTTTSNTEVIPSLAALEIESPGGPEIRVQMKWSAPVDLNLHIFEPGYKGELSVLSTSQFHLYESTAPDGVITQGIESSSQNSQIYNRAINDIDGAGTLRLALHYKSRQIGDAETCGGGKFAAIPAIAKISTPEREFSELILINPLPCENIANTGSVLIDIAEIKIR